MGWWAPAQALLAMPPDVSLALLERMHPWYRERTLDEAEQLRFGSVLGPLADEDGPTDMD